MEAQSDPRKVTRIITVPGIAAIAANVTPSSGLRVDWPVTGDVLWAMGSVAAAISTDNYYAGLTSLGLRIQIKGISEFVTMGSGASYVQFATAFPTAGFRLPMGLKVKQGDAWFIYIRNLHPTLAFTPDVAFGLRELVGP